MVYPHTHRQRARARRHASSEGARERGNEGAREGRRGKGRLCPSRHLAPVSHVHRAPLQGATAARQARTEGREGSWGEHGARSRLVPVTSPPRRWLARRRSGAAARPPATAGGCADSPPPPPLARSFPSRTRLSALPLARPSPPPVPARASVVSPRPCYATGGCGHRACRGW